MTMMFHLMSLMVVVGLVLLLLETQRQRDFAARVLRGMAAGSGAPRAVMVAPPTVILGRYAKALGIPYEQERAGPRLHRPGRIDLDGLTEILLHGGPRLIRCQNDQVELHLLVVGDGEQTAASVARALGGQINVCLKAADHPDRGTKEA